MMLAAPAPSSAPAAAPRWLLQVAVPASRRVVAEAPQGDAWFPPAVDHARSRTLRRAGAGTCWGTLVLPTHRHLAIHAAELLLLPTKAASPPAITVVAPHPRVRRAALPATALLHVLRGWLATPSLPRAPQAPVLYLLRTSTARPLREAEGARWETFGRTLRERGDALLVTLPAGDDDLPS